MKTLNSYSEHFKKYSLLKMGFVVIISIMIFTFVWASVQIKENQDIIEDLLRQKNSDAELFAGQSEEVLKESYRLLEELKASIPPNNEGHQFDSDPAKPSTDFKLLKTNQVTQNNFQNNIIKVNHSLHNIIPELRSNLEYIREMTQDQFWVAQKSAESAFDGFAKTSLYIQRFKLIAVLVSIILTFFILKNQNIADRKLAYQASTDMLTHLPNRNSQVENIQDQITKNPDSIFAVVFIDIDYFKIINDNYGHDIGDTILNKFSLKIKSYLKEEDILSRFGGDEFVLLLRSIKSEEEATTFIRELSSSLDTSFTIGNIEIFITASIGVSLYSQGCKEECKDPKILLKHADIAMYSTKQISRNSFCFFSAANKEKIETEHSICHALHTILRNGNPDGELFLKYQPLLNIEREDVTECEALIRWTNQNGKEIIPDQFIPLAEKNNLIEKINLFVINKACQQQYEWQENMQKTMRININLSGNKLIFKKLIDQLSYNLEKYNLAPSLFGIELTERTISEISEETIIEIKRLRSMGMKIAIDDFGTGYSSLSELKNLPVTTLKIDKTFIQGLPNDKKDYALVKTIINLGHSLELDIVAEGVETIEQHHFLKKHHCNFGQGYYYQHPIKSDRLQQLQMRSEAA